jgi:hypothetical protein
MRFECAGVLALLLACGTKPDDSATGSASTGATTGEPGASDTSANPPTGGEPTGAATGTASTTDTGDVPNLDEACIAACETLIGCDDRPFDECVASCKDSFRETCSDLAAQYFSCVAGLTCPELDDEESNACFPWIEQLD